MSLMSSNQVGVLPTASCLAARFDESHVETHEIAFLNHLPDRLHALHPSLSFEASWDDLDYLHFAMLDLVSQRRVALVSYDRSPVPGTMICVHPQQTDMASVIQETIEHLGLAVEDITWIRPEIKEFLS
jgi:hypothetical protein